MSTDEIRTRVARCIRDHYAAHGEAPSIRRLLDDTHVNRRLFYDAFRGLAAACRHAGVPVPDDRIHQVASANTAVRNRRITPTPRRVAIVAGDPPVYERLSTLQALLRISDPADTLQVAIDTLRTLTRHPLYPQARDPRRLLDLLEATCRQERAALRDNLDQFREANDALRDALDPFLDIFGDGFFDSEWYDVMRTFHEFMVSRGYQGSFPNMLLDCVEIAMASKGVMYRNGTICLIEEDLATPRLVWRA